MAVAMALIRGIARRTAGTIGNFWTDLTRGVLYVLLPISIAAGVFLIFQGVPQTLDPAVAAHTIAGDTQLIARGPVASQEAIKLLSGDGGGFFNVNSAHPFENPTALTNLIEMVLMLTIGAALTNTFGRMVGNEKQGWAVFGAMALLLRSAPRGWSPRNPEAIPPWRHKMSIRRRDHSNPAATWKARRFGSALAGRRCSPRFRPHRPTARSMRCMTASCRSAARS
jgi:hypothetical protein